MKTKLMGVFVLLLSLVTIVFLPMSVDAGSVLRSGEAVSIAEDQVVKEDFYAAGDKVNISGEIVGDSVLAAGQVTLNGSVGEDVFIISGKVDIHGAVGDDLRIIAGEVTIAEAVEGDLLVIGGSVNILSSASISGDVILFAVEATIEGSVGGDVIGNVAQLRIDSQISGDIDVTSSELTLGDEAVVDGSVRYVSDVQAIRSSNATIVGELLRSDPSFVVTSNSWNPLLIAMLILLFSLLAWYLVSRKTLRRVVSQAASSSPRSLAIGFVVLVVSPMAISILLFSAIGSVVGFVALLLYLVVLILGSIGSIALVGSMLMAAIKNKNITEVNLVSLVVGAIVFSLIITVPIIGQIIILLVVLVTVGALAEIIYRINSK